MENSFLKDKTRERISEKKTKKQKTSRIGEDKFMKRLNDFNGKKQGSIVQF